MGFAVRVAVGGGGGPLESTRFTADPGSTAVPAEGLSLMTSPDGTVPLVCVVTVPSTRPAPVIAVVAAAWVSPTTFGTDTAPLEITRFTAEPDSTLLPAVGVWLMTSPDGTVVLDWLETVPTTSPALFSRVVAYAWVMPTTFGTDTLPLETTRFTAEPASTAVPADGLSLMTLPEGTVVLDCVVTVPTVSPAAVIALLAAAWVLPTTFGTDTLPLETTRFTAAPGDSALPAVGLSLMTLPLGTVVLD